MAAGHTAVTPQADPHGPDGPCGERHAYRLREILDRLGDTWSVLTIVELAKGPRRFRELQRAIPGISQRMLTLSTRRLGRDGMVERTVFPTNPPQVEYRLTEMGLRLAGLISVMADWARDHRDDITRARDDWDAAHPGE